jgi:hypothetical protein
MMAENLLNRNENEGENVLVATRQRKAKLRNPRIPRIPLQPEHF